MWAALNAPLPELLATLLRPTNPLEWVVTVFVVLPVFLLGALFGAAGGGAAGFLYAWWRRSPPGGASRAAERGGAADGVDEA